MKEINNKYIISEDTKRILSGYNALDFSYSDSGIIVPNISFIEALRRDFYRGTRKAISDLMVIKEDDLVEVADSLIQKSYRSYPHCIIG